MIETDKISTITIQGPENNDILLYRDEMFRDSELRDAILQYDEIVSEVANIEYERNKLVQAKFAMRARLYNCANEYYNKKCSKIANVVEATNGDNDAQNI